MINELEIKGGRPIKTAILALGRSGWNIHAAALRDDSRFEIVSVLDPDKDRRRQAEEELGCDSYTDFEELLKNSLSELVVVATPSILHSSQSIKALKFGRHVVVEKPMSSNLSEAGRMIRIAEQNEMHLFVHHNYRFSGRYRLFQKILKSKKIGALTHIGYCSHRYTRRNDWQCLRKYSGGLMNNHVTHPLDQILSLVNSPVKDILCDMKHISDAGDVEDHVKMLLRTENGITIDVEISTSAATEQQSPEWTLLGEWGALTISDGIAHLKYYDPKKAPKLKVVEKLLVTGRTYGNTDRLHWNEEEITLEDIESNSFYDAVYATLIRGKKFPIDPRQIKEMMRVIGICRKQNPSFPGR